MDNVTLKKKLSTYVTSKGQIRNLSEEMLYEVLIAWESWTGPSAEFYRTIGFSYKQMSGVIGKAKKLKREGYFGASEIKAVVVEGQAQAMLGDEPCPTVEIVWTNGQLIRFSRVDYLVDFLKKSAG